ncbi:MAG TPA: asparaginase [Anaerolineaceae bacterium]
MKFEDCKPLVELTRGPVVESIHIGAVAIVDPHGNLVARVGNPQMVANLRSSSKPFQTLPLVESGGAEMLGLTDREISLTCASHSGTDDHVFVLRGMHAKIGVTEADLLCGIHPISHKPTLEAMRARGEEVTPARHNCSGKHTGMLAQARSRGLPIADYINPTHPIQQTIIRTFAEMCDLAVEDVQIGIDGCSAPTFAVPLANAALAFARLADPSGLPEPRRSALRRIWRAMTTHPDMVAGPGEFDTVLMEVAAGVIACKGGAEGYRGFAIAPASDGSRPALGITYKVADGDLNGRARPLIAVEILRQLGILSPAQMENLKPYDTSPVQNWRKIEVGVMRPAFRLERS